MVSGFVVNRLNIAVTGMERAAGTRYIPAWSEVAITLSIVGVGILLFTLATKYLPIFTHGYPEPKKEPAAVGPQALPVPAR